MEKLKIVETPDYILAVSDEEIRKGNYMLSHSKTVYQAGNSTLVNMTNIDGTKCKKIIAYQPKGGAPKLYLPLLPEMIIEDEIIGKPLDNYIRERHNQDRCMGFIDGYKSATKRFSEDDLRKAYEAGGNSREDGINGDGEIEFEEYLESIKQPKTPKWFVAEMEDYCGSPYTTDRCPKCVDSCDRAYQRLKTATNSEGQQMLVGHYEF
jgi:hypothetical protein